MNTKFKLGYFVKVVLHRKGSESDDPDSILYFGKIVKVHLSYGTPTYDIEFTQSIDYELLKRTTTRIHNVSEEIIELQLNGETGKPFTATKNTHSLAEWILEYKKVLLRNEGQYEDGFKSITEEDYRSDYDEGLTPQEAYQQHLLASQ
jgi:hypothetical protein